MAARELNPHELIARALKVVRIVDLVPKGATRAENEALASVLASWSQADRDTFADAAGSRPPSEETWRIVVEAVSTRPHAPESCDAHVRALPLLRVLRGGRS